MRILLRIWVIGIISWLTSPELPAQNTFRLNSRVGDDVAVHINQHTSWVGDEFVEFITHYPGFDTLKFISGPDTPTPILCNFHPDSSYSISRACCGSLDIFPTREFRNDSLEYWSDNENLTKIHEVLVDQPVFRIRAKGKSKSSVYVWSADLACFPTILQLIKRFRTYGPAEKCYYWNNITHFSFFQSNELGSEADKESGIIKDKYPEPTPMERLGEISVRLFDNQTYRITLDLKSGWVLLEYDSNP